MDNFFEILVAISVVWSILSSFKKKKPATTQPRGETTSSSEELDFTKLFSDIVEVSKVKPENNTSQEELEIAPFSKKEEPISLAHKFPKHKKRQFTTRLPSTRFSKHAEQFEFESAIQHEHFDTSIKEDHPSLEKPIAIHRDEPEINIDIDRMFDSQEIREAVLLSEILEKPLALRQKR